jgi:pimeloyl-ACP methyl ester carboxylesterase
MEETFITVHGLSLATYERPGRNGAIFFVHGNSSNARVFQGVWEHPSLRDYHLIALDLPGHGKSDRAKDVRSYTMSSLGKLIAEIIDRKNLRNVILAGHSIGGHIALSVFNFSSRIAGIALAGAAPLAGAHDLPKAYIISDAVQTVFKADATANEILAFCRNAVHREEVMPTLVWAFNETDNRFREEMGLELNRHFGSENFSSEIDLLRKNKLAVCLMHGEKEKVVNDDYLRSIEGLNLFRGKVQKIANAGHSVPLESPEQYSKILADFAAHVTHVVA